jgi:hypothetical protein
MKRFVLNLSATIVTVPIFPTLIPDVKFISLAASTIDSPTAAVGEYYTLPFVGSIVLFVSVLYFSQFAHHHIFAIFAFIWGRRLALFQQLFSDDHCRSDFSDDNSRC